VYGDSMKTHLVGIVVPNKEYCVMFAETNGIDITTLY